MNHSASSDHGPMKMLSAPAAIEPKEFCSITRATGIRMTSRAPGRAHATSSSGRVEACYNLAGFDSQERGRVKFPIATNQRRRRVMRKHWVTLLSMLGLAGASIPGQAQVLKGSKPATETKAKVAPSNAAGQAATQKMPPQTATSSYSSRRCGSKTSRARQPADRSLRRLPGRPITR